jgi:histidinol-phosphate/aromatic aminotransferase/cobyric acid decarboxylase-like protein
VRFPLADWIDDHAECRYNLGRSGMVGSVLHPRPTLRQIRRASAKELESALAAEIGVEPRRLFLTRGATEANAWVTLFRARAHRGKTPKVRVKFPEYPPLVDVARWAGFRLDRASARVEHAVVSLPRNPEGVSWSDSEFDDWSDGARSILVDETFRQFSGRPSHARAGRAGVWVTGTFTKFFGADDIRVGFAVAPPEEVDAFARFHGLVADEIAPYSIASALRILREGRPLAQRVLRLFEANRAALARALPLVRPVEAPVYFDRVPNGERLARQCLRASVLVCPGSFFGYPGGVRLTLTRTTFARDLAAYLRVRATVV